MAGNDVTISVRVRNLADKELGNIGRGFTQLLGGAIVPATAAIAALGIEVAGAGAALGVFGAAVAPQIGNIKGVATAQDAYNKAVVNFGKNSKQATSAQDKLKAQMDSLTPATRATAKSFEGLKSSFFAWSDSLSSSTMPIFTHGLNAMKNILPLLTPLVQAVSKELLGLSVRFESFSKTDKFKTLVKQFSSFAAGALHNVIKGVQLLSKVIAGWVMGSGFQNFIKTGQKEGPGLAKMFQNIAEAVGKFIVAAGPLAGLQLKVLEILANVLNSIPMSVLKILVPTLLGIVAALRLWTIAQTIWNGVMAVTDALLAASGWTLVVGAIALLVAAVVLIATKTTWFQTIWKAAWSGIKVVFTATVHAIQSAWNTVWNGIKSTFNSVVTFLRGKFGALTLLLGPIGAVMFIAANWSKVKTLVVGYINTIISSVKNVIKWIRNIVGKTIKLNQSGAEAVVRWIKNIIDLVRRFTGKTIKIGVSGITNAIRSVQNLINKITHLVGKTVSISVDALKGAGSSLLKALGFAHGGVVGAAASGGLRTGNVLVGEHGPEIVKLPAGSHVRSNPDSQRWASQQGNGGGNITLTIDSRGSQLDQVIVNILKKYVRINGGNVQSAIGI